LRGCLKHRLRKIYKELNLTDKIEASKIYCEYLKIEPLRNNTNYIFSDEAESEILVENGNIDWKENIELSLDITGCHINNNIFNENFSSDFSLIKKEIKKEKNILLSVKQDNTEEEEKEKIKNINYIKLSKDLETYIEYENVKNKKIISKNKNYKNYKNDIDFENFKKIRDKRNLEKKLAKSLQIKEKKKKEKEEIKERKKLQDKEERENKNKMKTEKRKAIG